jgi:NAD(P)-dependent dehydrogenase (short-subunit alcohol dehydrogenase family)
MATSSKRRTNGAEPRERREARQGDKLVGRVAMVTGGNRGIGAAICRSLGAQGATVAVGYSQRREQAQDVLRELEELGARGSIHQGNVGSAQDCRRVVGEVIARHGRLDILVNNAGIVIDRPFTRMEDEDWYKVLRINLSGAFFTSQAALPQMIERGYGRVVNISSLVGQRGNIGQANYAASSSALFGLTMTLARETAQALSRAGKLSDDGLNVTVNAVAPGFISETEMVDRMPGKVLDRLRAEIPLERLGHPDEVARVVHFLCADAASYITGQVWGVNGGMDMAGA